MKSMAFLIFYYFNIKSSIFVRYYAVSFAIFLQFRKPYVELMKLIVFIMIISSAEESPCINTMIHITIVGTSGPVMDLEEFQKISEEWENE